MCVCVCVCVYLVHCERGKDEHVTFFHGTLHMDVPVLADQQELIYINSVWTQEAIWKTSWRDG